MTLNFSGTLNQTKKNTDIQGDRCLGIRNMKSMEHSKRQNLVEKKGKLVSWDLRLWGETETETETERNKEIFRTE
jgi:protein-tyrosine phosphatase